MRKKLNLKTSWYSKENWDRVIEDGYLPLLAIKDPETHKNTPIHFPKLAPRVKDLTVEEYENYLNTEVIKWKLLNTFDVLKHLASASGVVLFTDLKDDPYREALRNSLSKSIENGVSEYDYTDRN